MIPKILVVFGTRPEAIKLCPLALELQRRSRQFAVRVCVTAQHRALLDAVLAAFSVTPDYDLGVMRANQSLAGLTARIVERLDAVVEAESPDMVVVQGDTTTTFAAALVAFYRRVPVGHVEAGLRTGDMAHPFPEELNRVLTTRLSALHFAPTGRAERQLHAEGIAPERVFVTGNTGIDAVLHVKRGLEDGLWPGYQGPIPQEGKHLVVLTAHRRESFGDGFERICEGVRRIAARGDVEVVYPVHPNPNVRAAAERHLRGVNSVHLIEPLDYIPFVDLLRRGHVALTDSGGIQEEAPSLGLPVLVMREKTERQEAVESGASQLVGTDPDRIYAETSRLLELAKTGRRNEAVHGTFGKGDSSARIADLIHSYLNNLRAD